MALSWLFLADWDQVDDVDILSLSEYDWAVSVLLDMKPDVASV